MDCSHELGEFVLIGGSEESGHGLRQGKLPRRSALLAPQAIACPKQTFVWKFRETLQGKQTCLAMWDDEPCGEPTFYNGTHHVFCNVCRLQRDRGHKISVRKKYPPGLTKEDGYRMYYKYGMTVREVAKAFGRKYYNGTLYDMLQLNGDYWNMKGKRAREKARDANIKKIHKAIKVGLTWRDARLDADVDFPTTKFVALLNLKETGEWFHMSKQTLTKLFKRHNCNFVQMADAVGKNPRVLRAKMISNGFAGAPLRYRRKKSNQS